MAPIILYNFDPSPPCFLVRVIADILGVELKKIPIKDITKEMAAPEMTKKNPQRTVPTVDDNGLYLAESRAIASYLISKYGKNDSLYPKDASKRVLVDQRLYFDTELYKSFEVVWAGDFFAGFVPKHDMDRLILGLEILNRMLEGKEWLALDHISLADYATAATMAALEYIPHLKLDLSKYGNISRWLRRVENSFPRYAELKKIYSDSVVALMEEQKKQKQGQRK
ncbi:glutathione S-transferase 1-1-like [Schistocerca americana]|uniref:glutathione S-transferase 1-1-like n=1 Tax=Schistocerca americana TaxID=7009 RepID=UPI001F4FEDE5|nr:glutathione S-transferase 1-1-like [Schistocerca americana]